MTHWCYLALTETFLSQDDGLKVMAAPFAVVGRSNCLLLGTPHHRSGIKRSFPSWKLSIPSPLRTGQANDVIVVW